MMNVNTLEAYTENVIDEALLNKPQNDQKRREITASSIISRIMSDTGMHIPQEDVQKMLKIAIAVMEENGI
jgi:hypothetical protein